TQLVLVQALINHFARRRGGDIECPNIDIAITALGQHRSPGKQGIAHQRKIDAATEIPTVEAANSNFTVTTDLTVGTGRDHIDGTANRIFAEQSSLWTAQYLNPLQVQQI